MCLRVVFRACSQVSVRVFYGCSHKLCCLTLAQSQHISTGKRRGKKRCKKKPDACTEKSRITEFVLTCRSLRPLKLVRAVMWSVLCSAKRVSPCFHTCLTRVAMSSGTKSPDAEPSRLLASPILWFVRVCFGWCLSVRCIALRVCFNVVCAVWCSVCVVSCGV